MVRQRKAEIGYKFAWTQDGVMLMREREGAVVREIDSEATLERLATDEQRKRERRNGQGVPGDEDMESGGQE